MYQILYQEKKMEFSKDVVQNLIEKLFQSNEHQYSPNGKLIVETKSIEELTLSFK